MVFHSIMAFIITGVLVNTNPQKDILHRKIESIMDVDRANYKTTEFFDKSLSILTLQMLILSESSPKICYFLAVYYNF